ncbi:MBL fold metallo-hydrolase [Halobacteriales archaeon SW_5_70_135]|nr:MAG: MBL fold metallo-hydrolase [Halobacteriales archaeon SW_5_70_135]
MVHSDWGDWLPTAVADSDPTFACWYLGFNGLVCKAEETVLFVDPYLGTGDPPRTVRMVPVPFDPADVETADAVLATHEHTDHVHAPSQAPLLADGARYVAPEASLAVVEREEWVERYGFGRERLTRVEPGDHVQVGDFDVAVHAARDPDAEAPVSYVLRAGERTLVHPGDARPGQFADRIGDRYDVDVALVAVGSTGAVPDKETGEPTRTTWYNDPDAAVELASRLGAERLVPTHFDAWKGLTTDPKAVHDHARSFDAPRRVEPVEIGDRVDV